MMTPKMSIRKRNENILETITEWALTGIDVYNGRRYLGDLRYEYFITLKGQEFSFDEFAAEYPHAANPSR